MQSVLESTLSAVLFLYQSIALVLSIVDKLDRVNTKPQTISQQEKPKAWLQIKPRHLLQRLQSVLIMPVADQHISEPDLI